MSLLNFFRRESTRSKIIAKGMVVPDNTRCVQCGICSYSCPMGIDVRRHAWNGTPVNHSYCLTCGECVNRCPRGVLKFDQSNIFDKNLIS